MPRLYSMKFSIIHLCVTILTIVLFRQIVTGQSYADPDDEFLRFEHNLISLPRAYKISPEILQKYIVNFPDEEECSQHIRRSKSNMPADYQNNFTSDIRKYLEIFSGYPGETGLMIAIFNEYKSFILEELQAARLSESWVYLPLAFSAMNPAADYIPEGAGIWQICKAVALATGLTVNETIDERLDFFKAAESSLKFLKVGLSSGKNDAAVLDQFMTHPVSRKNAMITENGDYKESIRHEPDRLYGRYLAFAEAVSILSEKNPGSQDYFFKVPGKTDTLMIPSYKLHKLAENQIFSEVIKVYNPHIRLIKKNDDEHPVTVYLPSGYKPVVSELITGLDKDLLSRLRKEQENKVTGQVPSEFTWYKVKRGDMLGTIARKHGVSVTEIKKLNHLKSDLIREGQLLKLP